MDKKISKIAFIKYTVIIVAILAIISVWPLRVWNSIKSETAGGELVSVTDTVDSNHDAIQDFIAQYDRIDSIDVYVDELQKGRYMTVTFWDLDNWKILYQNNIDLGEYEYPGFVNIPLGIDIESGANYRIILSVSRASYTLGTESIEGSTNAAIGTFYYMDTTVEGLRLHAVYNYAVPISKTVSILTMAGIVVCAFVIILLLNKFGKNNDKEITINHGLKVLLNPIIVILYAIFALMIYPGKMFDDRLSDIIFYEIGALIVFLIAMYALNHKRYKGFGEVNLKFSHLVIADIKEKSIAGKIIYIFDAVRPYIMMVCVCACIGYGCQYMNGLYNIYHTIAERWMVLFALLFVLFSFRADRIFNKVNLFAAIGFGAVIIFYFLKNLQDSSQNEYELNNEALLAICLVIFVIVLNLTSFIYTIVSKHKAGKLRLRKISVIGIITIAFFALIIVFRNERMWGVVLALLSVTVILSFLFNSKKGEYLRIVIGGLVLHSICGVIYCLLFRHFCSFTMGRFSMFFHTVTVTAEYLTVMLCMSTALLVERIVSFKENCGFKKFMAHVWKEALLFGVIASYMIFTVSRTGFVAVFFAILILLISVIIKYGIKNIGLVFKCIGAMIVSAIVLFPAAFCMQRTIPCIVGHPYYFEIDEDVYSTRGGYDWSDYSYMSLERFESIFIEKILSMDALGYNYPDDKYNYDEDGNLLYDEDGNPITDSSSSSNNENISSDIVADSADGTYLNDDALDEDTALLVASSDNLDAILSLAENERTDKSELVAEDNAFEHDDARNLYALSLTEDMLLADNSTGDLADSSDEGSIAEYSNGRFDIWSTYLKELNLTGHVGMSATNEDGTSYIHAHNVYIQVSYDNGIIAGAIFSVMVVAEIIISGVYYCRSQKNNHMLVVMSIFIGFAVAGLTEWNFQLCNPMTIACMFMIPVLFFIEDKNEKG